MRIIDFFYKIILSDVKPLRINIISKRIQNNIHQAKDRSISDPASYRNKLSNNL